MVFPNQVEGKAWKLARPYFGLYKVLSLTPTNAKVQLAHDPESESIFVALNCVRCCYNGVKLNKAKRSTKSNASILETLAPTYEGPITQSMSRELQN